MYIRTYQFHHSDIKSELFTKNLTFLQSYILHKGILKKHSFFLILTGVSGKISECYQSRHSLKFTETPVKIDFGEPIIDIGVSYSKLDKKFNFDGNFGVGKAVYSNIIIYYNVECKFT